MCGCGRRRPRTADAVDGTEVDGRGFCRLRPGQAADGRMRRTRGRTATWTRASGMPRWCWTRRFVTPDVSHQCLEPRTAMAYWQNGKLYMHTGTQSTFQTVPAIARWMNMDAGQDRVHQRIHGRRIRQQDYRRADDGDSRAAVEEAECAGDDAHQPRGRAFYRARAAERHGRA